MLSHYRAAYAGITLLAASLIWTSSAPLQQAQAEIVNLTLVHTNDIYNVEYDITKVRGGFARLAAVVKRERKSRQVLFTHAGDTFSPSLLSGFDQGAHIVALTNLLNPDVFVPGNHEFDFGEDVFRQRVSEAKFPILAANLRDSNGEQLPSVMYAQIYPYGEVNIGVVGLTADNSPVKSSPGNLIFENAVTIGTEAARQLRESGADLVIAVTHSPRSQDQELFRSAAFDIILSGDDHDLMLFYDGKTLMIESGEEAEVVTIVDLTIEVTEDNGRRRVSWHPAFRFVDTASVKPDKEMLALVKTYTSALSSELDQTIGKTRTALDSRRSSVRGEETAIGNMIADAIREAASADVAIMNGGGIRGNKEYSAGSTLTRRDILTELPFGNTISKLELSGKTIRDALENGYSQIQDSAGRFAQISGMRIRVDFTLPAMQRVIEVMVDGKKLDDDRIYTLATNNYLAGGGDGYTVFKGAKILLGNLDGNLLASEVIDYIRRTKTIAPELDGRIAK